eukprot:CAMPEP_0198223148 /NCGR_PEP_ID=MMETSP1445-20131203/91260_1 /TAXON_ID=36898 /ORGANISM="Pyramimonas sp., Strain CCMP2087" /LENGTH=97 /DNA_ID=CAMNT_0043901899 /DNA_START=171 /DNA_END=461 /DNA_ORIENTATION=-
MKVYPRVHVVGAVVDLQAGLHGGSDERLQGALLPQGGADERKRAHAGAPLPRQQPAQHMHQRRYHVRVIHNICADDDLCLNGLKVLVRPVLPNELKH